MEHELSECDRIERVIGAEEIVEMLKRKNCGTQGVCQAFEFRDKCDICNDLDETLAKLKKEIGVENGR